jgi:hypothetical protein
MKKIQMLACALLGLITFSQVRAQNNLSEKTILFSYYDLKNALITGNSTITTLKAKALENKVNSAHVEHLNVAQKEELLSNTRHIAESNDIAKQREFFGKLSENVYTLVKAGSFNSEPVYRNFCPMKRLYWLSEFAAIKTLISAIKC